MAAVKTDRILQGLIAAALVALTCVVIDTMREKVVVAGDTAPQFSIATDAGRTLTRSDFGGKLLVLNFWATWCPPCLEELPSLDEFQKTFADSGVVVLGVSVDQNLRSYRGFLAKTKVAFQTAVTPRERSPRTTARSSTRKPTSSTARAWWSRRSSARSTGPTPG